MSSSVNTLNRADEQRLRELASGIAKDIEDIGTLLQRMGFTHEDYEELCSTRMFRGMLDEAYNEWQGASNTHKRVKLKAAINIEQSLPWMYQAMVDTREPLSSRVKVFEVMARIGSLGNPEPAMASGGNAFNLTIQLEGSGTQGPREIIINASPALPSHPQSDQWSADQHVSQSSLLDALPLEEF